VEENKNENRILYFEQRDSSGVVKRKKNVGVAAVVVEENRAYRR
jgi:hypothetical protein